RPTERTGIRIAFDLDGQRPVPTRPFRKLEPEIDREQGSSQGRRQGHGRQGAAEDRRSRREPGAAGERARQARRGQGPEDRRRRGGGREASREVSQPRKEKVPMPDPSDAPRAQEIEDIYRALTKGLGHERVNDDNGSALIRRAEADGETVLAQTRR